MRRLQCVFELRRTGRHHVGRGTREQCSRSAGAPCVVGESAIGPAGHSGTGAADTNGPRRASRSARHAWTSVRRACAGGWRGSRQSGSADLSLRSLSEREVPTVPVEQPGSRFPRAAPIVSGGTERTGIVGVIYAIPIPASSP